MVIVLTKDLELVAKLQRKKEEYFERYKNKASQSITQNAMYKMEILGSLLNDGRVDTDQVRILYSQHPDFDERDFVNAATVIEAYNLNDLSLVKDGTGLK